MSQQTSIVAITDYDWLTSLKTNPNFDYVNLWTPTPWRIKRLSQGDKVYFLSKQEFGRKICGNGNFIKFEVLSVREAWMKYGKANGVPDYKTLIERIKKYTDRNSKKGFLGDLHTIGCIVLNNINLYSFKEEFPPENYGWSIPPQVVTYKYVANHDNSNVGNTEELFTPIVEPIRKKKKLCNTTEREGQPGFRNKILEAYQRQCCITGEDIIDILEAAHIQAYISEKSNHVQNGLLLRKDFHGLFDAGLITIDENYTVKFSKLVSSKYYLQFDGVKIYLPVGNKKPSKMALKWHYENIFRHD